MLTPPPKPKSLVIHAEGRKLVGVDPEGNRWIIGWCGNGAFSHWTLNWEPDQERGYYIYKYGYQYSRVDPEKELKDQIQAAEHKYGIYG